MLSIVQTDGTPSKGFLYGPNPKHLNIFMAVGGAVERATANTQLQMKNKINDKKFEKFMNRRTCVPIRNGKFN